MDRTTRLGGLTSAWVPLALLLGGVSAPFGHHADVTTRVSVDSAGAQANASSLIPVLSATGRFVAFESNATNLVPGDTNGELDVFVHDRRTGETTRVNVDSAGTQANGHGAGAALSATGRFVAFYAGASNLIADDTNGAIDVFVHDRHNGETTRVSVDSAGAQANGPSLFPTLSATGRFVAFTSRASNLVPDDTNGANDVFVHDRHTGETSRVNVDSAGIQTTGQVSGRPTLNATGRFVAFGSDAGNLVANDTNGAQDVFVHDRHTGETTRVSVDSVGNQANTHSYFLALSANGRVVVFESIATNLVADDTNGALDIFVHDLRTGETTRVSVDSNGTEANHDSFLADVSATGRIVAFASVASNLVADDTNGESDIFVHDRRTGTTTRASVDSAGAEVSSISNEGVALSATGRFVAFGSAATNLVADDTNGQEDIFVHDRLRRR